MENSISNKKRLLLIIPLSAAITIAAVVIGNNANPEEVQVRAVATEGNGCLPSSLGAISSEVPVRIPTRLPEGFELKGVEDLGHVDLYFHNAPLCPLKGGPTDLVKEGVILMIVTPNPNLVDSVAKAQEVLDSISENKEIAPAQLVDVGKFKGVGWEPFEGKNEFVTSQGEVLYSEPMPMPGAVYFFNDEDSTEYFITAMRPLEELLDIARSIQ